MDRCKKEVIGGMKIKSFNPKSLTECNAMKYGDISNS